MPLTLPNDVLIEILFYCTQDDLLSLALVSKAFNAAATTKLYDSISISSGTDLRSLVNTCVYSRGRASLIRNLDLDGDEHFDPTDVAALLSKVENLCRLMLRGKLAYDANSYLESMAVPSKLSTLAIAFLPSHFEGERGREFTWNLDAVRRRFPELMNLHFESMVVVLDWDTNRSETGNMGGRDELCSQLRLLSFVGSRITEVNLKPGMPPGLVPLVGRLKTLRWYDNFPENSYPFLRLAQASQSTIEELDLREYATDYYRVDFDGFNDVFNAGVRFTSCKRLTLWQFYVSWYEPISKLASMLPALETLTISYSTYDPLLGFRKRESEWARAIHELSQKHLKTLEVVIIENSSGIIPGSEDCEILQDVCDRNGVQVFFYHEIPFPSGQTDLEEFLHECY